LESGDLGIDIERTRLDDLAIGIVICADEIDRLPAVYMHGEPDIQHGIAVEVDVAASGYE
jgi:hypothetical protein